MKRSVCGVFLILMVVHFVVGQDKLSPKLRLAQGRKVYPDTLTISVSNPEQFRNSYKAIPIIDQHNGSRTFVIVSDSDMLQLLIDDANILFVDYPGIPKEESALDDPNFAVNRIRKIQHDFPNLAGENRIVSIKEQLFDQDDIDLRSKAVLLGTQSSTSSQHATDMATIVAGRGNTSPLNMGVVPNANLNSSDFLNLLPDPEEELISNNIHVQNHSYGIGVENYYGNEAMAYDLSIWNEPTLVHVFSVGNRGQQTPENGPYEGLPFATLTGNFKQAKNVLTIGALDTGLIVSPINSRGPAFDGRIKPELTAYGGRGTSDAAAIVSGVVCWLQDQYQTTHDEIPSSSLIRSLLIAGSDDIGDEGIDFYSGYGNVNTSKATKILVNSWFREVSLPSQDTVSISITVPTGISELKLAVSWVDPPAEVNATKTLVHDIDSKVLLENNEWLPWVLDSSAEINALNSPAIRNEDHLNNTEYFTIQDPNPGDYEVRVLANELTANQTVHVAWYLEDVDAFLWDYPTSSDIIPANSSTPILWESSITDPASIEYRWVGGDWVGIDQEVNLTGFFRWDVPDSSGLAQLKVVESNRSFVSDTFLISKPVDLSISFNCEEDFGLEWSEVDGATGYSIYEMGEKFLQEIGKTTDTAFKVNKSESEFYAIAPVFGATEGLRNQAVNYTFQGAFCYINFFSAQKIDPDRVTLNLTLSTIRNVSEIRIFRTFNEVDEALLITTAPGTNREFIFYDPEPDPGIMYYRAEITLTGGAIISSDLISIFIEKEGQAILFPNPSNEWYINVLSEGQGKIEILDRSGKFLFEKTLTSRVDFVIIQDLKPGLYFYRLVVEGRVTDTGKFLVYR